MTFGAETDEATSHRIMDHFVEAGGVLIDTADIYGKGASESIVGSWIARKNSVADSVMITTKARMSTGSGPNDVGLSRTHLRRALDASLRRLGTDYIDLYQMHSWDPLTPLDETLRFLDDSIRAGKIGSWGYSNVLGYQLTRIAMRAEALGFTAPATVQLQYNLLGREIERELVPAALESSVGILPWSPLAGGWLSGKYRRQELPAGASRLGENPQRGLKDWQTRDGDAHTWKVIDALRSASDTLGIPMATIALAWLADRPTVSSVILGVRTVEQLEANLGAADLQLDTAIRELLDEASAPPLDDYPYYPQAQRMRSRDIRNTPSTR
jgi:aryl-alcohol dehydrogenase (NADP+)